MDIDLLKTFLEVKNTRHFGRAAENLYLTQAAISARVKQLEKILSAPLFTRYRNNLQLTPTGERLVPHAEAILIAWERARQDVALKQEQKFVMTIGATTGLWDLCLQNALNEIYEKLTNVSIRAEAHSQDVMVRRLMERTMDVAMMYEPTKSNDLQSVEVAPAELVLVSNESSTSAEDGTIDSYVSVDWGASFDISFAQFFQGSSPPVMHTSLSRIALDFILARGGCAYLPYKLVEEYLGSSLFQVHQAPVIQRPIYMAFHKDNRHTDIIESLIGIVAKVAKPNTEELRS